MNGILLSAGDFVTKIVDGEVVSEKLTTAMSLSDRIGYALQRTLIGLIIVFGVLAVIWLVLSLFKVVFYKDPNKKAKKTAPVAAEKDDAPAKAEVNASVDEGAVVAAIIAAISAMRSEQGVEGGFRVVSFKRGTNKPWNKK